MEEHFADKALSHDHNAKVTMHRP